MNYDVLFFLARDAEMISGLVTFAHRRGDLRELK